MFASKLVERVQRFGNPCVVGFDPDLAHIPPEFFETSPTPETLTATERARVVQRFLTAILEAVADLVPVIKPQIAFFEAMGSAGLVTLAELAKSARAAGVPVLLDAKRGDVPSTAQAYANAYLADAGQCEIACDAITVNPYLGLDSLAPFFSYAAKGKGVFVCVRTSNPGSADFQEIATGRWPLYRELADRLKPAIEASRDESGYSNVGFVVGGQHRAAAAELRRAFPGTWFLVPGIGAQGAETSGLGPFFDESGMGALVSSSRAVLYPHRFGRAASWSPRAVREAVEKLTEQVATARRR